jgi:D-galactose 1-dehydrogenase
MNISHPIRLAIVGLGRIAEYHLAALATMQEYRVVAVCDHDPERRALAPVGAEFFTELSALLATVPCDAVVVATPTASHATVAQEVLSARKHLLLEKPAVTSRAAFAELETAAQEAGVVWQTALHMSHGAETDWAVQHLAENIGRYGPVTEFACQFHDALCVNGVLHPRAPSVLGSWLDSGINALSVLARFLSPAELKIASASFVRDPRFPVLEVGSSVHFRGSQVTGGITTDWTKDTNEKTTTLRFANGQRCHLNHSQETITWEHDLDSAISCSRQPERLVDHYTGVFREFAAVLGSGVSNVNLSRDLHRLLFAATGD